MRYKEVVRILEADGWQRVRQNGSHVQFKKMGVRYLATVPNHGSKEISVGVLNSLARGTGLSFGK